MSQPPPRDRDAFYVGYLAPPQGLVRFRRWRTGFGLALGLCGSLALAWSQRPPARSRYEYGVARSYSGVIREQPYPMLVTTAAGGVRTWLLAAELKHGAQRLVRGLDGRRATATATLIQRDGLGMLELHGGPEAAGGAAPAFPDTDLGEITLSGEVVDGKCWLGAMNPGAGATHRLCAARCLLGGLPPLITGTDDGGHEVTAVLVGPGGTRLDSIAVRHAAARVRVTGRLRALGTLLLLEADTTTFRRVLP